MTTRSARWTLRTETQRTAVIALLGAVVVLAVLVAAGSCAPSPTLPRQTGSPQTTILPVETATQLPGATDEPDATGATQTLSGGALVIATLGDSLTEGQGDDAGLGGYPGRLAGLVESVRPGSKIVNFGHSGWSSGDLIEGTNGEPSELSRALAARPNVALVWVGSNDLWYLYEFGPEPITPEAEAADLATFESNVDRILRDLTAGGAVVVVALLDDQSKRPVAANPNPTEPAFPATTKADLAAMSKHVAAYNLILARKAAQYGGVTVDFSTTTIFTDAATLYGDGNHPNSAGYDGVAQVWWSALRPMLG